MQRGGAAGASGLGATGFNAVYDPHDEAGLTGWLDGVAFAPSAAEPALNDMLRR